MAETEFERWLRDWTKQASDLMESNRKAIVLLDKDQSEAAQVLINNLHALEVKMIKGHAELRSCYNTQRASDKEAMTKEITTVKSDVRDMQTKWSIYMGVGLFVLTLILQYGGDIVRFLTTPR